LSKALIIKGVRIPTLTDIRRHILRNSWNGRGFESDWSNREVFTGQCEYTSTAMSEILTGTGINIRSRDGKPLYGNWKYRVRGWYSGDLSASKTRVGCDPCAFTEGKHCHSWVEFGGKIIDPTWWQFADDPVKVYVFELDDKRFTRDKNA
jgi:hypothetical protein